MFQRDEFKILKQRIEQEPRKRIQVIQGPRQVGKTTLIRQLLDQLPFHWHYASADAVISDEASWISSQWHRMRIKLKLEGGEALLVFDEIQKISAWSDYVKKEWDEDTVNNTPIKLVLLGSSTMLIQQGLSESLAGRYELISLGHWSYREMRDAFGFSLEDYVWFGGYPGAANLIKDEARWRSYISDSLIEAAISRDVLQLTRIDKPALLRRLFDVGCHYSGQIVSFTKILGQLQDAGNTNTLAHYLGLLDISGLLGGLQKYSEGVVRQRGSSPKFQVYNNALKSAVHSFNRESVMHSPEIWGRWVESAIGAHLITSQKVDKLGLFYWRHRDEEVDFVLQFGKQVIALEVKSGDGSAKRGLDAFRKHYPEAKTIVVGRNGFPVEEFLLLSPRQLFD